MSRGKPGLFIRLREEQHGIAMITVITVLFVMSLFASVIALNVNANLDADMRGRRSLTALDAADAGLDRMVFVLGQTPSGSATANWDSFLTSYNTTSGTWWGTQSGCTNCDTGSNHYGYTIGKGFYKAHVD